MHPLQCLGWREGHLALDFTNVHLLARVSAIYGTTAQVLGLTPEQPLQPALALISKRADDPLSQPTVGDWVLCEPESEPRRIHKVLPRSSCFVRKVKGRGARAQVIAANVDRVFIVTAVGADLSPRRIERYLAQVLASGAQPVIVLNKTDQPHDSDLTLQTLAEVAADAPVVRASAVGEGGLGELLPYLEPGSTVALVGSSGVGKSSLINRLLGAARMETATVRSHDQTGTHTTTHRQLLRTDSGALLIDTPGMRELGLWEAEEGLSAAFPDLVQLAEVCRFSDCQHDREPGCAVREALHTGLLPAARLASYQQLTRELNHQRSRSESASSAQTKQRMKAIHRAHRAGRKLHGKQGWDGE